MHEMNVLASACMQLINSVVCYSLSVLPTRPLADYDMRHNNIIYPGFLSCRSWSVWSLWTIGNSERCVQNAMQKSVKLTCAVSGQDTAIK